MNIVLLPTQPKEKLWKIDDPRQVQHINTYLKLKKDDYLKVGIKNKTRFLTQVVSVDEHQIIVKPLEQQKLPEKLPITLIVALPRPKVLRRLIMDSVTMGVKKIILIHSYRVDKSYWQSPFLKQIDEYITLGLEQAGDTVFPEVCLYQRFKPFVEDILAPSITAQNPTYVAHPYTDQSMPKNISTECQIIVGPEGGFIPYEIDLLVKNGCEVMKVGDRILRTETAISYILGRLS